MKSLILINKYYIISLGISLFRNTLYSKKRWLFGNSLIVPMFLLRFMQERLEDSRCLIRFQDLVRNLLRLSQSLLTG